MSSYVMLPAPPRCCPVGSHTEFSLPHLSPLCLCHHPAHLLRNANSLVLAISFGIFHQPVNSSSQLPCIVWQVPSLYLYWATILRIVMVRSLQARIVNLPMGTTVSHYPGSGPSSASTFLPGWAVGRQKDSSHSGKPLAAPPLWVWRFLWEDSRGGWAGAWSLEDRDICHQFQFCPGWPEAVWDFPGWKDRLGGQATWRQNTLLSPPLYPSCQ